MCDMAALIGAAARTGEPRGARPFKAAQWTCLVDVSLVNWTFESCIRRASPLQAPRIQPSTVCDPCAR